jgi:hypothetical protein
MIKTIQKLMRSKKFIIAAVHLLPLPGSPNYDRQGGMAAIIKRAKRDTKILAESGANSLLFTNEADMPYEPGMALEAVTAFSVVVQEVMGDYEMPFGINALIDAYAGLCIAHATGADFIRGLFSGVYVTDVSLVEAQGHKLFRLRANLGVSKPYFFHNLNSIMGTRLFSSSALDEVRTAFGHISVDGFTLPAIDLETFSKIREVAPNLPFVVGSGTNFENLHSLLSVCDGAIVASCLHVDGKLLNPVDPERVSKYMKLFNQI